MKDGTSQHILNTSTNLLGFCLLIITSLRISNYSARSSIDEVASVVAILLIFSSLTSFFSLQTKDIEKSTKLEQKAEYLFAFALI